MGQEIDEQLSFHLASAVFVGTVSNLVTEQQSELVVVHVLQ